MTETPCVEWPLCRNPQGYGQKRWRGRTWLAHRWVWEQAYGPIPDGMCVLHHCDNPPCVSLEPGHLFLGTVRDNALDMVAKGRAWQQRRTHCPKGHPYDEFNTRIVRHTGARECRACRRLIDQARYYQAQTLPER